MRLLLVLTSFLLALGQVGCGDPTSSRSEGGTADPVAKLTVASTRAGDHGSSRALILPQQGTFYAPQLGEVRMPFLELSMVNTRNGEVETAAEFSAEFELPKIIASGVFDADGTYYTTVQTLDISDDILHPSTQLATIDIHTGEITLLGESNPFSLTGVEIDGCGQIYATTSHDPPVVQGQNGESRLFTIDKTTGIATPKANELVRANGEKLETNMDLAFDAAGNLYATSDNVLYMLDTGTGAILDEMRINGVPEQWFCDPADPNCEGPLPSEVMSIAFDKHGVLYGLAMRANSLPLLEVNGQPHGAPLLEIDPATGDATVVAWTGELNFHGGDIAPAKATVCHKTEDGRQALEVSLAALPAHLSHGDVVVGTDCGCDLVE